MQQIQLCIIWYFNFKLGYSSFFCPFLIAKMNKMRHPIKFLAKPKQYNVRWRDTTHFIITSSAESLQLWTVASAAAGVAWMLLLPVKALCLIL